MQCTDPNIYADRYLDVVTAERSNGFTNTVNICVIWDSSGNFKILIFEDERIVCSIKYNFLVRFSNDLETERTGRILELVIGILCCVLDLGTHHTQARVRYRELLPILVGYLFGGRRINGGGTNRRSSRFRRRYILSREDVPLFRSRRWQQAE